MWSGMLVSCLVGGAMNVTAGTPWLVGDGSRRWGGVGWTGGGRDCVRGDVVRCWRPRLASLDGDGALGGGGTRPFPTCTHFPNEVCDTIMGTGALP